MKRIMAIDYGEKKTGIAVTDTLQIAAHGLVTLPTGDVPEFLKNYNRVEIIEKMVIGLPHHPDGTPSSNADRIEEFAKKISRLFPQIEVELFDESYSSRDAKEVILKSGARKKKRRDKELVDKVAAVLILQRYLKHI